MNRLRLGIGLLVALVCGQVSSKIAPAEDDPIAAARATLYTSRAQSLAILEEAVRKSPERIDYWAAWIHALETDGERFLADCASRAALAIHPHSRELWLARIALLDKGAAFDALSRFERVPGAEEEARDVREIVELGLRSPFTWDDRFIYGSWANRLINQGNWDRAEEIVRRGWQKTPRDNILLACGAMVLAHRGEFSGAMRAQVAADFPQSVEWSGAANGGLGNLLLAKGEPELAIRSLCGKVPDKEVDRLILAQALFLTGQNDRAEAVLQKCVTEARELLRIGELLRREEHLEAAALSEKLIQTWIEMETGQSERLSDILPPERWPSSVAGPLRGAMDWLLKEFRTERQRIINQMDPPPQFPNYVSRQRLLPTPENLAKLKREISDANPRDAWLLRFEVVRMLEAARRYEEAAAASIESALGETPKSYPTGFRAKRAAVDWSINRRRAQSVRFFAEHPDLIGVARSTAYNVEGARWNSGRVFGREWLAEEEVTERLSKMGPGVLALVHDKLEPNTVTGRDRTVFIRVVENIGGEEDIPLLIDLLGLTVRSSDERDLTVVGNEENNRQDRLSEAAFHRALEKLTGVKNTAVSREDRVYFWHAWWDANARRILGAGR